MELPDDRDTAEATLQTLLDVGVHSVVEFLELLFKLEDAASLEDSVDD